MCPFSCVCVCVCGSPSFVTLAVASNGGYSVCIPIDTHPVSNFSCNVRALGDDTDDNNMLLPHIRRDRKKYISKSERTVRFGQRKQIKLVSSVCACMHTTPRCTAFPSGKITTDSSFHFLRTQENVNINTNTRCLVALFDRITRLQIVICNNSNEKEA